MPALRLYSPNAANSYGGVVNLSPLQNAIDGLIQVHGRQVEADRQVKFRELTGRYALELKRAQLELSADGDPATRPDRFLKLKDELRGRALKELDESGVGGGNLFAIEFNQSALSEEFQLRAASTKAMQQQTEARLEVSLDTFARLAGEGSGEQREQFKTQGMLEISDAMDVGALDPVAGVKRTQKFLSDIDVAQVRRDIYANPHGAEQALLGDGYRGLSPEARVMWLERATGKAEALDRKAVADEDRQYKLNERYEKDLADALQKDGDRLLAAGGMSPAWLEAHREELSSGDYRFFYQQLMDAPEKAAIAAERAENRAFRREERAGRVTTDKMLYADLMEFARAGVDVSKEARGALINNDMAREDYDRVMGEVDAAKKQERKPEWQKQGEDFIAGTLGANTSMDPAAAARKAAAVDQWTTWARTHQDATPEQAAAQRNSIIKENKYLNFQQTMLMLPLPTHLPDRQPTPEKLQAAKDALNDEFENKHFGDRQKIMADPEYRRQAKMLLDWVDAARAAEGTSLGLVSEVE